MADIRTPNNAPVEAPPRNSDRLGNVLTYLPKWIALAIIAWQARLSIEALAGRNAIPSLLTRFGREASYWELVCWAAALIGILYGAYSQHLLHRRDSQDMLKVELLEKRLLALHGQSPEGGSATTRSGLEQ